jgi:hypothetical protein
MLVLAAAAAWANDRPWPPAEKSATITGCKTAMLANAERDYLKSRNLTELSPPLREKFAQAMKPLLDTCSCAIDHLEKRWSLAYVTANRGEVNRAMESLLHGPCKPNLGAK